MSLKSTIKMEEELTNKERTFGSNLSYFPAEIELIDGTKINALFTMGQLNRAMTRAARNPEDMPKESGSFFNWLFS